MLASEITDVLPEAVRNPDVAAGRAGRPGRGGSLSGMGVGGLGQDWTLAGATEGGGSVPIPENIFLALCILAALTKAGFPDPVVNRKED